MLGEMARKAEQPPRQAERLTDERVVGIEPGLADMRVADLVAPAAPLRRGETAGHVGGEAERLADLAHGAARPVRDHRRDDAGAIAPVFLVDVLDDLLAPLMLEIDVDIGRLAPLGGDEAREEQVVLGRVDRGDAEHVADGGIGGRAAPLAENALVLGDPDDVEDGEEVALVSEPLDEGELLLELRLDAIGKAARIAHGRPAPGHLLEPIGGLPARRHGLVGIVVAKLVEREIDARQKVLRLGDGVRRVAEQARHLGRPLQVALGIDLEPAAGGVDRHLLADAGEDVLQVAGAGLVVERVVDGEERHGGGAGDAPEARQPAPVVAAAMHGGGEPDRAGRGARQAVEEARQPIEPPRRHDDQQKPGRVGEKIVDTKDAFALLAPALAYAEKPAQPAPAGAVDGIRDDVRRAVGEDEARSDDELEIARHAPQLVARHGHLAGERMLHEDVFAGSGAVAQLLGRRHAVRAQILERAMGAHDPGDRVAVGDAEAGLAEEQRRQHHVLRMGGAAQEREIGGRDQLGIGIRRAHANNPCRYQRGLASPP